MMEQERIFLLHTIVIDVLELMYVTCGLLWCFISCLDSHSDGTHSLQMIYILDDQSTLQQMFIFGWIFPLNQCVTCHM